MDNLSTYAQGATPTGSLYAADAIFGKRRTSLAQRQALYAKIEIFITSRRQICFGDLLCLKAALSLLHSFEHRTYALVVHVNANGQINLIRIRVCSASGRQTKNWIDGQWLEVLQHEDSLVIYICFDRGLRTG